MIRLCIYIAMIFLLDTLAIIEKTFARNQAQSMNFFFTPEFHIQHATQHNLAMLSEDHPHPPAKTSVNPSETKSFFDDSVPDTSDIFFHILFAVYSETYGRLKGESCLFYPSCSRFSGMAIARYGLIRGMIMTGGRLVRAHVNADHYYPVIETPDGIRWVNFPESEVIPRGSWMLNR